MNSHGKGSFAGATAHLTLFPASTLDPRVGRISGAYGAFIGILARKASNRHDKPFSCLTGYPPPCLNAPTMAVRGRKECLPWSAKMDTRDWDGRSERRSLNSRNYIP